MLAIGCMRLSTEPEPAADEARGIAVIVAALDAGVRLLDTADVYAPTPDAIGHNETLVARALQQWSGDASSVTVATKGGLTRPDAGRWVPDGRANHLRAACEASLRRLGRDRIDLYQLHAVDPARKLSTTLRALAKLQREGLVDRVGLCNVTRGQLEQARDVLEVSCVQVELSPRRDEAIRGGVVALCRDKGIDVLAYRPLAGTKGIAGLSKDPALTAVASRHAVDPIAVALAWVRSLGVVALPGPTTVEHASAGAKILELTDDDRETLDARFRAADVLRRPVAERRPPDDADGDVVIVMGMPGAGKSTHARPLVEQGYARLNRDELGGRLSALVPKLEEHLAAGRRRVVLDNTYGSRAKRNEVIEAGWRHGVPVRCVHVDTAIERARVHAVTRMLERHGRLLSPEEIRAATKTEPNMFGPRVQIEHVRAAEAPERSEGFASLEVVQPAAAEQSTEGRALVLDLDRVAPGGVFDDGTRAAILRDVQAGFIPIAFRWNPDRRHDAAYTTSIEPGAPLSPIDVHVCPHPAGPPVCWCRPPMPGLLVLSLRTVGASPQRCRLVGSNAHAERYAAGVGIPYLDVETWRAG